MFTIKLVLRHVLSKKLRLALTLAGILVTIAAFGLLRTVISAWDVGSNVYSAKRVITRNGATLANTLPFALREKIRHVDGVEAVTQINWFNGIYLTPKNFFPKFAVHGPSFFEVYPELRVDSDTRRRFLANPTGCLIGDRLAKHFQLKTGDVMNIAGAKYSGAWRFTVSGVYHAPVLQEEWQLLFHWDYFNSVIRARNPDAANGVGAYVSLVRDPAQVGKVSAKIDELFTNSVNITRSDSENAFQLGWFQSTEAIFSILSALSFLLIAIILLVISNTMLMAVRERVREYATLKAIGFGPYYLSWLIMTESVLIASLGGALGALATPPLAALFASVAGGLLPYVQVNAVTFIEQFLAAVVAGVLASALPAWSVCRKPVIESLRGGA